MPSRVSVYVAEDHPIYLDGLVRALAQRPAFEVVGSSQDGRALSPREHEILERTAGGASAPEIAGELQISTATVKTHLRHLYEKLGVSERAAAVAEAMRRGLLR